MPIDIKGKFIDSEMTTNDYIELWAANGTNANGIAVSEMNLIIEALN